MEIAILLATYNSSRFLEQQLDSLYSQTYKDWNLYVHDDGSTDNTLEILKCYNKKHHNIHILGKEITHLGPKKNFMYLLENVNADYYFFCDHDDVWLPNKIEVSLNNITSIEGRNRETPVIFHSDLKIVDGELNQISPSMWKYAKIFPNIMHNKKYVLTSCYITGCTLAINNKAKELIPPLPENAIMHDWWIGVHAVLQNMKIISYSTPTILYRLHGNNDSGIPRITFVKYIKRIVSSFFVSEYDKKVQPFVKEYRIRHYHLHKSLLVLRKIFS